MFNSFQNISKLNNVWKLLNENYFNSLDGKIGNTVMKIDDTTEFNNYLIVQTDNENVKTILSKNEAEILKTLKSKYDISITSITIV